MGSTLETDSPGHSDGYCRHCGQPLRGSESWKKRRFTWGILLANVTFIPFLISLPNAFQSISSARTTGLGAVAGGISEGGATFAIAALIIFAVGGIVLLVRGFSAGSPFRAIVSILGIAWCGLTLAMTCVSLALLAFLRHH